MHNFYKISGNFNKRSSYYVLLSGNVPSWRFLCRGKLTLSAMSRTSLVDFLTALFSSNHCSCSYFCLCFCKTYLPSCKHVLTTLTCRFTTLTCRFTTLTCRFTTLTCRFTTLTCRFTTLTCRFTTLTCRFTTFTPGIQQQRNRVCSTKLKARLYILLYS